VNTFVEDASIAQKKANVLIIFYSSLSSSDMLVKVKW